MGTPITWRNVDAPDTRGALLGMAAAGQSINTGFDKLGEVLKQREQQAEQNWNQQKTNNTQAFLNEIGKFRTPEEYQAALASGELDQMRQGFGAQVDANAVRAAEEGRLATLQQRSLINSEFQDKSTDRAQLPEVNNIQALIAAGKHDEARAELDRLQLRNEAPLYDALKKDVRQGVTEKRADAAYDRSLVMQGREDTTYNRTEAERIQAKQVEDSATTLAAEHQQNIVDIGAKQGKLAISMGLPVTPAGLPDYQAINENEAYARRFQSALIVNNLEMPSDTEAMTSGLKKLLQGGMSATNVNKVATQVTPLIDTAPEKQLVGVDKDRYDRGQAAIANRYAEVEKNNSLFVSSNNVTDKIPELRKALKDSGVDNEGIRIVQDELVKSLKNNPDQVLHIPAIIAAAGGSESWGPFSGTVFSKFRGNFQSNLKSLVDTDAYRKQVEEFRNWENGSSAKKERAKNAILNSVGKPTR